MLSPACARAMKRQPFRSIRAEWAADKRRVLMRISIHAFRESTFQRLGPRHRAGVVSSLSAITGSRRGPGKQPGQPESALRRLVDIARHNTKPEPRPTSGPPGSAVEGQVTSAPHVTNWLGT